MQIKLILLLLLLLPVKLQAKNTWMVMNIYGNVHLLSHLNEMSTMVLVIHLWGGGGGGGFGVFWGGGGAGRTLGIFEWGCAAGTLEPLV